MTIFDIALEKRFDDSPEIDYVDLDDADSFLIKDVPSGLVMKLTVADLKAFFTASLSGAFATLVGGKVPDAELPDSGHIAEGTNLYYTNARSRTAISVSGSLSYNSTTGVISYTTPSSLPASDVYAWAKQPTKPTYTYTEVGAQIAGSYPTGSGTVSGTNTGDQTITLTGDVTGSGGGSFAATIANAAVTLTKMANMATASLLGRNTAGAGAPEVLSAATAKTLLSLNNVDNTSDAGKPVSTAQAAAIALKANKAQAAFVAPTFSSGWSNLGGGYEVAGYMIDEFGFVFLKGVVAGPGTGSPIFTLPSGFRPGNIKIYAVISGGTLGDVRIDTAGVVTFNSGNASYVSLDGIVFKT